MALLELVPMHLLALVAGLLVTWMSRSSLKLFASDVVSKLSQLLSSASRWDEGKAKHLASISAPIYTRGELETKFAPGTWQREASDAFGARLTDPIRKFPCIYATKGYRANELRYLFIDSEDLDAARNAQTIAAGILNYHVDAKAMGQNTSLLIMAPPPTQERTVEGYNVMFWALLKRLRKLDPAPWPANVPHDTGARSWCFNFDSEQVFLAPMTPAHQQRQSRASSSLVMVYQPRWVFHTVFNTPKSRNAAAATVRNLIDKYDAIPRSPELAHYNAPGTTESRQYFLLDENETAECPYETLEE